MKAFKLYSSVGCHLCEEALVLCESADLAEKVEVIDIVDNEQYFEEYNEFLKAKTDAVLDENLTPLFCCGETLSQREEGIHFDFVKSQLTESLFHLSQEEIQKVVIAKHIRKELS